MKRYHLAKLVQWAGTLDTRKRMQKVVYLLQAAGCPFDADFFLHRYGPYSQDVAQLTDMLVRMNVFREIEKENRKGRQYGYELTDYGREQLEQIESRPDIQRLREQISPYETRLQSLLETDLRTLEVASTIAYYHHKNHDWSEARRLACQFKEVDPESRFANATEKLARSIVE